MRKRIAVLSLLGLVGVPLYGMAAPLANLTAVVRSASGAPLAHLQLELVNVDTGRAVVARTNGLGELTAKLETGTYAVNAAGAGYTVLGSPVVRVAAGSETAQLTLASLAEAASTQENPPPDQSAKKPFFHSTGGYIFLGALGAGIIATVIIIATHSSSR